jgi:hypothetical protein
MLKIQDKSIPVSATYKQKLEGLINENSWNTYH